MRLSHGFQNFLPNAVYEPSSCIQTTLKAARQWDIRPERICLEVVESERIDDHAHVVGILEEYKRCGLVTAIDDFGAGHAGLNLLAEFQPDNLKMDMKLIRDIDQSRPRQVIARNICNVADELGIRVIAEGVETASEFETLRELGIILFQGYYFGRPAFERCEPPLIIA
jgi:EAL domain-containing protein (putative c-di-GMP-specific phosphodiesterase class I)